MIDMHVQPPAHPLHEWQQCFALGWRLHIIDEIGRTGPYDDAVDILSAAQAIDDSRR